ncbi:MAG: NAD-dependent epimerase/dehydratase family protein, partial [Candidatus Micrarchaeota archaeon]|nr:NAD-dependent epimerase/dehydratase family protein [Candidatus Micrarchaeota archaeon]
MKKEKGCDDMKRILITGGSGFIGSGLVRRMLENKNEVHLFLRRDSNIWRLKDVINDCKVHIVDIMDRDEVFRALKEIEPEIIYHLATYGAYHYQENTNLIIDTNLKGSINLLDGIKNIDCKIFVNVGSSSEYGVKDRPMKETDMIEPNSLYAITKAAFTHYCRYAYKYHGIPTTTLRIFSAYGYYEEPGRLIPTVIISCLKNTELKLSSPFFVRDFIFIEDVLDAIEKAGEVSAAKGSILNIGTGKQHTIKDVFEYARKITGSRIRPVWGAVERKNRYEPK